MRLAIKGTLAFLILYLVVLGASASWLLLHLRSLAQTSIDETAHLIGSEIAKTLSGPAVEALSETGTAPTRLQQIVESVGARSDVIASLAVVNERGDVVAADGIKLGRQLAIPQVIFAGTAEVAMKLQREGGNYHLFVPLLERGRIIGYLRLAIQNKRIASLYDNARQQFLLVAAVGLLAVGVVALVFHSEVSRSGRALTEALVGAVRGERVHPRAGADEFSEALQVARQLGQELTTARRERVEADQRLGVLMKATQGGVLLVGPEGHLEFASPSACELLGSQGLDELAQQWPGLRMHLDAFLARFDASSPPVLQTDFDLPRDGVIHRLRLEIYRVQEGGRTGHLIFVKNRELVDALENELGLAIQMRALARFYAAFAHDLKAPLNAMVMNLELLRQTLREVHSDDATVPERQQRYIGILREELARLNRQLTTLVSHAASSGDMSQMVDLTQVASDIAALLGPQAKRQRVSLITHVPPHPITLTANPDRLKQALLNIAINALEAMPKGGELTIELGQKNGQAQLLVRDTGPGIPPELLNRIYEMHFTTKTGGTGVGLHVARSVVESYGGSIRIESEIGAGTCFTLYLPATQPEAA